MIISQNTAPSLEEFQDLLEATTTYLNQQGRVEQAYFLTRNAQKLEDDVLAAMEHCAQGTVFADTIVKISGQKFPDIVAAGYYGLEVKSSKDSKWITLGGSVNESTRVAGVERIFLLFGQLVAPVEFRCRPYEDCLSDVVVTHYPRYKIDMQLELGHTIFDKMETTYDQLRTQKDPVGEIVHYYKKNLKPGESVWWIDSQREEQVAAQSSMTVKLWRTLSAEKRTALLVEGIALFPEIMGDSPTKYERFSLWLVTRYGVVSSSLRDAFSAGGQCRLTLSGASYENLPQIYGKIHHHRKEILGRLIAESECVLKECWNVSVVESNRMKQWIWLVSGYAQNRVPNIESILACIFA